MNSSKAFHNSCCFTTDCGFGVSLDRLEGKRRSWRCLRSRFCFQSIPSCAR